MEEHSQKIDKVKLDNWIKRQYPKFSFKYPKTSSNPEIDYYVKRLMLDSFSKRCSNEELKTKEERTQDQFLQDLPEIIHMMEGFFLAGQQTGLFHNGNISKILDRLKEDCRYIEYLPEQNSGVYGRTRRDKKCIQINSNMKKYSGKRNLTPQEVRRLYLFHELGHILFNIHNNPMIEDFYCTYPDVMYKKGKKEVEPQNPKLLGAGFLMIEELLAQEMGEIFTYFLAGKDRPKYTTIEDRALNLETESNIDFYQVFQKPTINLGRTLRGCGSEENNTNKAILYGMLKRALDHDFVSDLISEYDVALKGKPDAYRDLMNILINMGIVCDKKYASFGHGLIEERYTGNARQALANIQELTDKYVDYRPYPLQGFPQMDFNHPTVRDKQISNETSDRHREQLKNTISMQQERKNRLLKELRKTRGKLFGNRLE